MVSLILIRRPDSWLSLVINQISLMSMSIIVSVINSITVVVVVLMTILLMILLILMIVILETQNQNLSQVKNSTHSMTIYSTTMRESISKKITLLWVIFWDYFSLILSKSFSYSNKSRFAGLTSKSIPSSSKIFTISSRLHPVKCGNIP